MKSRIQTFEVLQMPRWRLQGSKVSSTRLAAGLGLFFLMALLSPNVWAQERVYSGVVSSEEGMPLPGVNVLVKGTTIGTQTDMEGNYTITASQGQELVFSFLGFTTQTIP